jgi:hypothetical protein
MGLFSSKKKTYVDTTVMRVVEDAQIPNAIMRGTITSLFTGKSINKAVEKAIEESTYRSFERMYRYAETGDYYFGLPDARVMSTSNGTPAVKAVIESIVGSTVTLNYSYFRPINNLHMAWKYITETKGFNHETNELSGISVEGDHQVYLLDLVPVYSLESLAEAEANAVGAWNTSPRSGFAPIRLAQGFTGIPSLVSDQSYELGEVDGFKVKWVWEVPMVRNEAGVIISPKTIQYGEEFVSLADYDGDLEYFQAKYQYSSGSGQVYGYFTYNPEDGTYPTLDSVFAADYTSPGTYFPFAIFRRAKQNRTASGVQSSTEYLTTKKLLKYLNMDFQEIGDKIHENPDIADVEQAVLMMGVPINTTNKHELGYLIRFFENLKDNTTFSSMSRLSSLQSFSTGEDSSYAIEIADADFRLILSYDAISVRIRSGSIGPKGTFTNTLETTSASALKLDIDKHVRVFKQQLSAGVYKEVRVTEPRLRYDIYAGKSTIGAADDDTCLIPLDYAICKQMPILAREQLYFRSLHFVFNSRVTQKVKWYQTGVFKTLLTIVAIVITIMSLGTQYQTLVLAASIGVTAFVWAAITIIIELIVAGWVMSAVAAELAQILGPEFAAFIAIVATVYGGFKAYQAGGVIAGSTAANMLKAGSALTQGTQKELGRLFAEYQNDVRDFGLLADQKNEELQAARDLLGTPLRIDPFAFIGQTPLSVFGESPSSYFNRTIHAGNIGIRSIEIIRNFVGVSLTLPTVQDSLGNSSYV